MNRFLSGLMSLLKWSVFILVVAAVTHISIVQYLPDIAMSRLSKNLVQQGPINSMRYPPRPDETSRAVVRPSPDLIYSICPYDVSEGPVLLSSPVPDTYWSLSAFASDTENYLVINDAQAGGNAIDLILMAPGQVFDNPQLLPTIEAKTPTGVILTRTLIPSDDVFPTLDAMRKQAICKPFVAEPEANSASNEGEE